MPYISIQLSADISHEQKTRLSHGVSRIMSQILNKDPALTAVNIYSSATTHWSIGLKETDNSPELTAFIDARISANSNTQEEKRTAIAALYQLLEETLGSVSPVSYVALTEIPTTDWGYGGKTQHERQIKRTSSGAIDIEFHLQQGRRCRAEILPRLTALFR